VDSHERYDVLSSIERVLDLEGQFIDGVPKADPEGPNLLAPAIDPLIGADRTRPVMFGVGVTRLERRVEVTPAERGIDPSNDFHVLLRHVLPSIAAEPEFSGSTPDSAYRFTRERSLVRNQPRP
jgi:hypothetical protein